MTRRPDDDLRELERELVRTRWQYHCVRNGIDRLATSLALQVGKAEQLAATEAALVAELKRRAPDRLAKLDEQPNLDTFDETLKRVLDDARRREEAQKQKLEQHAAPRQKKRGAR